MNDDKLVMATVMTLKILFAVLCGCYGSIRIIYSRNHPERMFAMLVVMVSWIFLRMVP